MARSTDRMSAALLVAAVILLAGSFAGFGFGATGRDLRGLNQATPLLLQSAAATPRDSASPCVNGDHRKEVRPALSAEPAPAPAPSTRIRPISI
jgi:hypothetical protein